MACNKCDTFGGIKTVACCCGHGKQDGVISLEDGRDLIIKIQEDLE